MFRSLLNLFFPKLCAACSKKIIQEHPFLCMNCEEELINSTTVESRRITRIFRGRVPIEKGASLFYFDKKGKVQAVIHQIKYREQKDLAIYMAETLAQKLGSDFFEDIDLIIPVPLHPKKRKKRGFNQSEFIAEGIHNKTQITLDTKSLLRVEHTQTQTKKGRFERWQNVSEAFQVVGELIDPKAHILLIDDVLTTGATLEACAKALLKSKSRKISVLTLAWA